MSTSYGGKSIPDWFSRVLLIICLGVGAWYLVRVDNRLESIQSYVHTLAIETAQRLARLEGRQSP